MNLISHYKSITTELEALKDRVRNFIDDKHWLTDGEWREAVLRAMIAKRLPETVRIGRGFIMTNQGPSTQCDVLLYKSDAPILFRDSDLVLLTPDAVLGVVEVKSRISRTSFRNATAKLAEIRSSLGEFSEGVIFGLFSFEATSSPFTWLRDDIPKILESPTKRVDLFNLGCSAFAKWWDKSPIDNAANYSRWHSYDLENMSAGYFITNLIDAVCGGVISRNQQFWFPETGKEGFLRDVIVSLPNNRLERPPEELDR